MGGLGPAAARHQSSGLCLSGAKSRWSPP